MLSIPKLEVSKFSSPLQESYENYSSLLKRNSHWNANFDFDYLSQPALKFFRQKINITITDRIIVVLFRII